MLVNLALMHNTDDSKFIIMFDDIEVIISKEDFAKISSIVSPYMKDTFTWPAHSPENAGYTLQH